MASADVHGHRLKVTSEGATVRGVAGKRLTATSGAERRPGTRYRAATAPRLTPEAVYKVAADRDDAIRLLRRNGYIL